MRLTFHLLQKPYRCRPRQVSAGLRPATGTPWRFPFSALLFIEFTCQVLTGARPGAGRPLHVLTFNLTSQGSSWTTAASWGGCCSWRY